MKFLFIICAIEITIKINLIFKLDCSIHVSENIFFSGCIKIIQFIFHGK